MFSVPICISPQYYILKYSIKGYNSYKTSLWMHRRPYKETILTGRGKKNVNMYLSKVISTHNNCVL